MEIGTDGDEWKIQVSDAFVFVFVFFFNLSAILSQQPGSPSSETQQTRSVNTFFYRKLIEYLTEQDTTHI